MQHNTPLLSPSPSSYNRAGILVLLSCVALSFMWFAYLIYFSPAVELDELDSLALLADSGEGQEALEKYWLSSEVLVHRGQQVYQIYCASCHGPKGLGDGPAGQGLVPPPRDLTEGKWKRGGRSIDIYTTLLEGMEGTSMVSFSYLSKLDRWTLVHYVRSLTSNKAQDDAKELEEFAQTAP